MKEKNLGGKQAEWRGEEGFIYLWGEEAAAVMLANTTTVYLSARKPQSKILQLKDDPISTGGLSATWLWTPRALGV